VDDEEEPDEEPAATAAPATAEPHDVPLENNAGESEGQEKKD
jgi:hypothetical protein